MFKGTGLNSISKPKVNIVRQIETFKSGE